MKILMIGNKESGKTTYMSCSLAMLMDSDIHGFRIKTSKAIQEWCQHLYQQVSNGSYPLPTDKRERYHFSLYYKSKKVLSFDLMDYNGGIITEADAENLGDDIKSSDGVMIFLDSEALLHKKSNIHRLRRIIALICQRLEANTDGIFPIIIVLTKYDKIPAQTNFNQLTEDIRPFVESIRGNQSLHVRLVPTVCSQKEFYNIDLPLLEMLSFGCDAVFKDNMFWCNFYHAAFVQQECDSNIFDDVISAIFGMQSERKKAAANRALFEKENKKRKFLEKALESLKNFINDYEIEFPK